MTTANSNTFVPLEEQTFPGAGAAKDSEYLGDFSIENKLIILRATQPLKRRFPWDRKQHRFLMKILKRANENEVTLEEAKLEIKKVWSQYPNRWRAQVANLETAIAEAEANEAAGRLQAVQP